MKEILQPGVYEKAIAAVTSLNPILFITLLQTYSSNKCLGPFNGQGKSVLYFLCSILLAVEFLIVYGIAWIWQWRLRKGDPFVKRIHALFPKKIQAMNMTDFKAVGFQLTLFLYEPMFHTSLSYFDCMMIEDPNENFASIKVMKAFPDVVCYVGFRCG